MAPPPKRDLTAQGSDGEHGHRQEKPDDLRRDRIDERPALLGARIESIVERGEQDGDGRVWPFPHDRRRAAPHHAPHGADPLADR
jgi:hypothetical protein